MSKGTSYLVWAERFNLKELKSQREGTYNQSGSKESKGSSLVVRSFAEARNAQLNNELYVFDEKKTDELMLIREANIKKQAEEKEKKAVSSEDLLAIAMVKALGNVNAAPVEPVKVEKVVDDMEDLKTIIKENDLGFRIGKDDTREKVEAKIKEAQKK